MIEILSHRGLWRKPEEKNSLESLALAFAGGFGVETDVRDSAGRLVISHDPPVGGELGFGDFLSTYVKSGSSSTLAINVKSDGIQQLLASALVEWNIERYFVFDMSYPELTRYRAVGMPYYARLSDEEPEILGLAHARGVWVDGFGKDWADFITLEKLIDSGVAIALVSPELHKRDKTSFWTQVRSWIGGLPLSAQGRVMLCTDHPDEALKYFHE